MDKYKIIKNLGDGTYGAVFKAKNEENGEIVAIKKMKRKYRNWDECMSLREVKSLRKMNHPNLVKLKEVLQVKDELMLVFEYVDLNLYQMYMNYKEKKSYIPESTIKKIIYQTALGLDSLHNIGYFHRDLKPENVLINLNTLSIKVCDFGLAREVRCRPPFTEYVSTRWYRAPEILLHSQVYNSPIDIFALGCIMAELYNLSPLFSGQNEVDQFYKIVGILGTPQNWNEGTKLAQKLNLIIPKKDPVPLQQVVPRASMDAIQLLSDMLQYDPLKRPTALQITKYPYFDDIQNNFSETVPNSLSYTSLPSSTPNNFNQIKSNNTIHIPQNFTQLNDAHSLYYVDKNPWQTNSIHQSIQAQNNESQNNFQKNKSIQQQQSLSYLNQTNKNKPLNPFQQYKDEFLKSQNMYDQQHNQDSNFQNRATNKLLQSQQNSQSTNYHFSNLSNMNGFQSQLSLGGTLDKPLNVNHQYDIQKMQRKQNLLLKKNYDQQQYENYNSQNSYTDLGYNQPKYNNVYGVRDSDKAANFFNQFNKISSNVSNIQYQQNKNGSVPPEYRNQRMSESEVQNINKMFEDKLNWAF